jgi:hypothetical protein
MFAPFLRKLAKREWVDGRGIDIRKLRWRIVFKTIRRIEKVVRRIISYIKYYTTILFVAIRKMIDGEQ